MEDSDLSFRIWLGKGFDPCIQDMLKHQGCFTSKGRQLRLFYTSYITLNLFGRFDDKKRAFVVDLLNDDECWINIPDNGGFNLDRKVALEKLMSSHTPNGSPNPFGDFGRYQIACWSCSENEISNLFERFKQKHRIQDEDKVSVEKLAKSLSGSAAGKIDPVLEYWSYVMAGCTLELKLENAQHLYVAGLDRAQLKRWKPLEAIEFFWRKIKALPDNELSAQEKSDILVRAANHRKCLPPERRWWDVDVDIDLDIDLFLWKEMTFNRLSEVLDFGPCYDWKLVILNKLAEICQFDICRKLIDEWEAEICTSLTLYDLLIMLGNKFNDTYHRDEVYSLFEDLWTRLDFKGNNLISELKKEVDDSHARTALLWGSNTVLEFVLKNDMADFVVNRFEKCYWPSGTIMRMFVNSIRNNYSNLKTRLEKNEDKDSLEKLSSFANKKFEEMKRED